MSLSKEASFLTPEVRLATFAKGLSHPARIAILKILAERSSCLCGELVAELPLAQATVSQHLKALKDVGLVESRRDGPRVHYSIDEKAFAKFQRSIRFLLAQVEGHQKGRQREER